ncbi:MAG TPA: hypothetical protein VGX23_28750 [Actinocrinis sp.]|nr:hypothetical protein [Actinocrinis sp.]
MTSVSPRPATAGARTAGRAGAPSPPAGRIRRLRLAASAFAVLIAAVGLATTPAHQARAAAARPQDATPVTKSGTGQFGSLKVTVSQTQDLIDQNVDVSWTGAAQTYPSGAFYTNFLEIMQCWGDDPATGPDPSQCEYGGLSVGAAVSGQYVTTREVATTGLVDPKETDVPAGYGGPDIYMPFVPAPQSAPATPYSRPGLVAQDNSDYYDNADTNEIDYTLTDADGSGNQYFHMLTNTQSPGLGCGQVVAEPAAPGGAGVEPCWLVVVPRGNLEVDGNTVSGTTAASALQSSPLSASNWANRIQFPLDFQPVTSACAIGANEVQTAGDEQVADAMDSWQPGLCAKDPTAPYSYSEVSDDSARNELNTPDPGLQFVSDPLSTSFGETGPATVYAPVAVNALTVSFYIQYPPGSASAGGQITALNLNARLLAKLLTQSYRDAVAANDPYTDVPSQNPVDLTADPEFRALNPQFASLNFGENNFGANDIPDLILPFGDADAYTGLWTWITQDPAARAFLDGAPDNDVHNHGVATYSGMVVNPNYYKLQLPIEDFPTVDPYCAPVQPVTTVNQETPLCGIALHPYVNTMDDGADEASQGNQGLRTTWSDIGDEIGNWGTSPAEADGKIAILALTDSATAAKYDLPTAGLCDDLAGQTDANGQITPAGNLSVDCVPATAQTLAAAVADALPSAVDPSVLIPNTHSVDPYAYPLTTITYAATVPSMLTPTQGAQYAQLLDYIAGPGNVTGLQPGELAPGYAPLPASLLAQTLAVAASLPTTAGVPAVTGTSGAGTGTGAGSAGQGAAQEQVLPDFPVPTALPTRGPVPTGPASGSVVRETLPAYDLAGSDRTAPDPVGTVRWVLMICLLVCGLSVGGGPVLLYVARRLGRGWFPPS